MIVWSVAGAVLALALALAAWWRSRRAGGYYDDSVYGMTGPMHRRYALAGAGFTALFAGIAITHSSALLVPAFAAFTLLAVFYGTSFLRGFSDGDV